MGAAGRTGGGHGRRPPAAGHRGARDALARYRRYRLRRVDTVRLDDYIVSLANYLRARGVTALFLRKVAEPLGASGNIADLNFAAAADGVVVMRHVEINGRMDRVISVIKSRDSEFDPLVRRCVIDTTGFRIGDPVPDVEGTAMSLMRLHAAGAPREPMDE